MVAIDTERLAGPRALVSWTSMPKCTTEPRRTNLLTRFSGLVEGLSAATAAVGRICFTHYLGSIIGGKIAWKSEA